MCNISKPILSLCLFLYTPSVYSLNLNSTNNNLSIKSLYNDDDVLKFPSSLKFDSNYLSKLPTNEDNLFSNLDLLHKKQESDKKLQEINEAIKDGVLVDPRTNQKLFQNEEEEEKEIEVKDPSLGISGNKYKEGVDSASDKLNSISNKLESDGVDSNENEENQLRENLLHQIMNSQHPENFGA